MSIATFIATCRADWRKAQTAFFTDLPKIASVIDTGAALAAPFLRAFDPTVAVAVASGDALFDQLVAHLEGAAVKNTDGTVTLVINADTVTQAERAIADARAWIKAAGL